MRSFTVTLPDDMVEEIEARVANGDYASESDLVRDGLERLLANDPALDDWLRDVVVPRCRERANHPGVLIPAEEVVKRSSVATRPGSGEDLTRRLHGGGRGRSRRDLRS